MARNVKTNAVRFRGPCIHGMSTTPFCISELEVSGSPPYAGQSTPDIRWYSDKRSVGSKPRLKKKVLPARPLQHQAIKERLFSPVPAWFSLAPGGVSTHGTLLHPTHQRNSILMAVHSHELRGHQWSCEKRLDAFPLKAGKTANMLMASRSTFMVACVPSADRIGNSADTDQCRLSAGHRYLCLPDHRKRRTGRTHQRKDCRRLRRWGNPAA